MIKADSIPLTRPVLNRVSGLTDPFFNWPSSTDDGRLNPMDFGDFLAAIAQARMTNVNLRGLPSFTVKNWRRCYDVRTDPFHLKCLVVILFSLLSIQCSVSVPVNIPASSIPPQAWRPGDLCKFRKQIYMSKDGNSIYLTEPGLIESGRKLDTNEMIRHNIVGIIEPGDLIRISKCYRYTGSSFGGTYLEGVLATGPKIGETVVWHCTTMGNKHITTAAGLTFATPDPDWYISISSRRQ